MPCLRTHVEVRLFNGLNGLWLKILAPGVLNEPFTRSYYAKNHLSVYIASPGSFSRILLLPRQELSSGKSYDRPSPEDIERAKYAELIQAYGSFLEKEFARSGSPGAAVTIVKDTIVLYSRGFGVKKASGADSVDINTVFRVGSLSKGFAAVLAGVLVDEGAIDWEDRIIEHLPEFALKSRQQTHSIELAHLLSHSTGLPYHAYTNLVESGKSLQTIIPYFRDLDLIGRPGEVYAYQNAAFGMIEEVVLASTQRSFQRQIAEKLFTPAGMESASVSYAEIMSNRNKALPHSYSRRNGVWRPSRISEKYYNLPSTGGVNASIADMERWLMVLLGHRPEIISETALDFIFSPFVKSNNKNRYFSRWNLLEEAYYGMGWRILDLKTDTVQQHGGFVNGFRSEIALDRKEGIGICILTNGPSDMPGRSIPKFWDAYYSFRDSQRNSNGERYTDYQN